MPIKRKKPKARHECPPNLWARINDAPLAEDAGRWAEFRYQFPDEHRLLGAWHKYGEEVLATWIKQHPGTRPSTWWRFDAPRVNGDFLDELRRHGFDDWVLAHPQPRAVVGGTGTPGARPESSFGILRDWWTVDPSDPPLIESQAAYLKRHGLLVSGEARRLRSSDFDPEPLPARYFPEGE